MDRSARGTASPRAGHGRARTRRPDGWWRAPGCARAFAPALLVALAACTETTGTPFVAPDLAYTAVTAELESLIRHEMEAKRLPSVTVALVDDQRIVWAQGFGYANPADSTPATAATVHRVGSVSKLFTDIGIMQLVERGELDLDVPVRTYLPEFAPAGDSASRITLRHLMSHRAGLMREPPVGNYFDPGGSTLEAMVQSLNGRDLVYRPGQRTKYSNAGIGVVGYVLERTQGRPFTAYLRDAVLRPMGLTVSAFEPTAEVTGSLAKAMMWSQDGREWEAPTFELGMTPAGSMYSTVLELGRFLSVLFAGGQAGETQVLSRETLEAMWTPQFAEPGARAGFGIGFNVSELDGYRRVGHGGAIYGFATDLAALPDEKLGAVVIVTLDIANTVAERLTNAALRLMLAAKNGQPLPVIARSQPVPPERARTLAGRYARLAGPAAERIARNGVRGDENIPVIDLIARDGQLFLENNGRFALRALGDTLIVDDRRAYGLRLLPLPDGRIVIGSDTVERVQPARPAPPSDRWAGLIGEYGWDHNTLFILERGGRLRALIEWFFEYPLDELGRDVFKFPQAGLYDNERLVFTRDSTGRATQVEAAGVVFRRRDLGDVAGGTFRIEPVQPVETLRAAALEAEPPAEEGTFREPDLVELNELDPTIRYDIRYATSNNFMGTPFYTEPHAMLQRPAAQALVRVQTALRARGYALLIHDAYRPWFVTRMFWDATPPELKQFVADPAQGSRHNRGAAVDLTLVDLATGEPVPMPSGYDEFTPRAFPEYRGGTSLERWHRELLRSAMEANGFRVYEWEWWHFDHVDWREYPILNRAW